MLNLFWELACWHALAKLRLHSETTVQILEAFTTTLGKATRVFATACEDYDTRELPSEEAARGRRELRLRMKSKAPASRARPKTKKLNISTFKDHNLGHYPWGIRHSGTSDNFSTQTVSLNNILLYLPHKLTCQLGRTRAQDGQDHLPFLLHQRSCRNHRQSSNAKAVTSSAARPRDRPQVPHCWNPKPGSVG